MSIEELKKLRKHLKCTNKGSDCEAQDLCEGCTSCLQGAGEYLDQLFSLLERIEKVKGMKRETMVFKKSLEQGGGYPSSVNIGYNAAIDDVIKMMSEGV